MGLGAVVKKIILAFNTIPEKNITEEHACEDAIVESKDVPLSIRLVDLMVVFKTDSGKIDVDVKDVEIFDNLNIGDRVRLYYTKRRRNRLDYIPPDYETMQVIESEVVGYGFVALERTE